MEGIRFAWKIFSFSDVPSSSSNNNDPSSSASSASSSVRSSSSNSNNISGNEGTSSSSSNRRWFQHRRIPLHRACSLHLPILLENNNVSPRVSSRTALPGAYLVTRNRGFSQLHRLEIPEGVTPGSEFTALVGSRQIQIQCPRSSRPGHFVRVSLPGEPITRQKLLKMAPLTKMEDLQDNENTHLNESKRLAKKKKTMRQQQKEQKGIKIKVPTTIQPGVDFTATVRGKRYLVTCPDKLPSNRQIKIIPSLDENGQKRTVAPKTQLFDVTVPKGVKFNDYFDILANGQRVTVQCPPDASEGDTFRCKLALEDILSQIQLRYESISGAGWHRIVRREDLKLQWVYFDPDSDDTEEEKENKHALPSQAKIGQFDIKRSAFCRKLTVQAGKDPRMQTGSLTLVPADEALVESKLLSNTPTVKDRILAKSAYESIMTYGDIAVFQGKPLKEKAEWFRSTCNQLAGSRDDGSIKIVLQRETLLEDSVNAVMSLGKEDLRKVWRFEFVGEPGVDSGGVSREWFQLASEQIFDPENGLWLCSASNQTCVTINPDSASACKGIHDHLVYFRFAGRLLGRALFDQQLICGHLVQFLYKHLLGWPLTYEDLAAQDEAYYHSLEVLRNLEDVACLCLDFTVTEQVGDELSTVELVPGGTNKEVTNDNMDEFLETLLHYRMLERTKPQLTELLLGFLDVVPEPALAVFDSSELELLLCGLPIIDVDDWEANTRYSGTLKEAGNESQLAKWFWDIVRGFDHEMRARLLQFVTGTSGVPSRGFSALQGIDGTIKTFAIFGIENGTADYPRAHTCFNRLDVGIYESMEEFEEKLRLSIAFSAVGFGLD